MTLYNVGREMVFESTIISHTVQVYCGTKFILWLKYHEDVKLHKGLQIGTASKEDILNVERSECYKYVIFFFKS